MPPDPSRAPEARFASLIAALYAAVAARLTRPGRPGLEGTLIILICTRLQRMAARFTRLAARVAAGQTVMPRPRPAAAPPRRQASPYQRLPRKKSWLLQLVPAAAFGAPHLQILLDDPATQALLSAAPQLGRTLRPLCRALGLDLPPPLQRPKPAPARPPAAPASRTPDAPPHRAPPHRAPPHRAPPHRKAPDRTAPHRTAPHRTAPHRKASAPPPARSGSDPPCRAPG